MTKEMKNAMMSDLLDCAVDLLEMADAGGVHLRVDPDEWHRLRGELIQQWHDLKWDSSLTDRIEGLMVSSKKGDRHDS